MRRLLALALDIVQRQPFPAYALVLEQYREDFIHLRVGLMTGRVESSWGEQQMQELGTQVEFLLEELRQHFKLVGGEDLARP